ncbi:MAG: 4Fe-4S dicluster domain-containing protein [Rubripirellula sp.]
MSADDRRTFLKKASVALPIVALSDTAGQGEQPETDPAPEGLFQPEEFWRERMTPPEDGRKYGWLINTERCFGCHGCEVSCKAENDVPLGKYIRQTIYRDVGEYPQVARVFLPMSCQHCEDAPCIKACPCGALHKQSGGTVAVNYETCCGHGSCVDACPYGAIYIDPVANQAVKCHNCYHRADAGMEPACVATCPAEAIHFGDLNDPESEISQEIEQAKVNEQGLVQLRVEKQTKPQMWFTGPAPAEIESSLPKEGESLSPEAYDIYNWKKNSE